MIALLSGILALTGFVQPAGTPAKVGPEKPGDTKNAEPAKVTWPKPRQRAADAPVDVVYCTKSAGFRHDVIPHSRKVMGELSKTHKWFDVTSTDTTDDVTAERMKTTDVLMFYTTGMIAIDPRTLEDWVQAGGALVGVHCATDTLSESPKYVSLIGGIFDGHPWNERVEIRIDQPEHAAMKAFGLKNLGAEGEPMRFAIEDEIYQFKSINPDMTVLMSLSPGQAKMQSGRAYPLAWTRSVGKGRVFYTALGHRPEVWNNDAFRSHVLEGIRWAARAEAATGPSTSKPSSSSDTPR